MSDARKPPSESGGLFANNCPAAGLDVPRSQVSSKHICYKDKARPGPSEAAVADDGESGTEGGSKRIHGKYRKITNAQSPQVQDVAQVKALEEDGDEGRGCPRNLDSDTLGRQRHHDAKVDDIPVELLAAQGLLKCTRSVCNNAANDQCRCRACVYLMPTAPPKGDAHKDEATPSKDNEELRICTKCGHEADSRLCCQALTQSKRAGERQRQEVKRARKEQASQEEAASRRPREIRSVEEASTPAQLTLARMRARLRKGTAD